MAGLEPGQPCRIRPTVCGGVLPRSAPYGRPAMTGRMPARQPPRPRRADRESRGTPRSDRRGVSGHMGGLPVA